MPEPYVPEETASSEVAPAEVAPAEAPPAAVVPARSVPPAELRVSDREREDMVTRIQVAFAEGRLGDEEFDTRVRAALAAKTRGQLDRLVADLPAEQNAGQSSGAALLPAATGRPGKLSLAYKTSLRRGGRWQVPAEFTAVSYKGGGTVIDLRAAELTSSVTTIRAIAYKSRVQVLVPPGMRVEFSGIGVTSAEDVEAGAWPADAPAVHVRGVAYKGTVEIRTTPPDGASARAEIGREEPF